MSVPIMDPDTMSHPRDPKKRLLSPRRVCFVPGRYQPGRCQAGVRDGHGEGHAGVCLAQGESFIFPHCHLQSVFITVFLNRTVCGSQTHSFNLTDKIQFDFH